MVVDLETARRRASLIGAASASVGDVHSLFVSHKGDRAVLLWAERIALSIGAFGVLAAIEPAVAIPALLALLLLIVVFFPAANRYLPGIRRHRGEGLLGMNARVFFALLPPIIGATAVAFLGASAFSMFSPDLSGLGAILGISMFLFLYFRWARKRCDQVWEDTP